MSYTHALCNRGAVHAQNNGSDWTVCGKRITHLYSEVAAPVTCKVCARSIELSRDYRVARKMKKIVEGE